MVEVSIRELLLSSSGKRSGSGERIPDSAAGIVRFEQHQPGALFNASSNRLSNLLRIALPGVKSGPEDNVIPRPVDQVIRDVCVRQAEVVRPEFPAASALLVEVPEAPLVDACAFANRGRLEVEIQTLSQLDNPRARLRHPQ